MRKDKFPLSFHGPCELKHYQCRGGLRHFLS
jgi:hypothetical protein